MTITISTPVAGTARAGIPAPTSDAQGLRTLVDLMSLTDTIAELHRQERMQLAGRPTVTAHLGQAESHLAQLHRSLAHAQGTLRYNAQHTIG